MMSVTCIIFINTSQKYIYYNTASAVS